MSGGNTFRDLQFPAGARRRAFTLIELLVVVSIVVLLMALLLPALSRARKQARAVVCQANLRQWGTVMATAVSENNGRFPTPNRIDPDYGEWYGGWRWGWVLGDSRDPSRYEETKGIRCCPMATKPVSPSGHGPFQGGTFLAWGRVWPEGARREPRFDPYGGYGSYGFNLTVGHFWRWYEDNEYHRERAWQTVDVRGRDKIPVYNDSAWAWGHYYTVFDCSPPKRDAIPTIESQGPDWNPACINRHNGGINVLFLNWSVRKAGLKELWTLKWHRQYDTAGPWTKAGGVQPEDWPKWMQKFKDY